MSGNDTERNTRTRELRKLSRISNVSGSLQYVFGRRNGKQYRLAIDIGAAINILKREVLTSKDKTLKFFKKFSMGNDEHTTQEAVYLIYWNKKQLFHIVGNDFSLIEEGIIGLDFFRKYKNYSITKTHLIIEKWKLPLLYTLLYTIHNQEIEVPYYNYSLKPKKKREK